MIMEKQLLLQDLHRMNSCWCLIINTILVKCSQTICYIICLECCQRHMSSLWANWYIGLKSFYFPFWKVAIIFVFILLELPLLSVISLIDYCSKVHVQESSVFLICRHKFSCKYCFPPPLHQYLNVISFLKVFSPHCLQFHYNSFWRCQKQIREN